jgi:hypothetical protein
MPDQRGGELGDFNDAPFDFPLDGLIKDLGFHGSRTLVSGAKFEVQKSA